MTRLSVNLNKVALLRNQRPLGIPSVTRAARIALDVGAGGITVHPRPDARHIRTEDVESLATLLASYPHAEFNIEGNPFHNLMTLASTTRCNQCTLVPDDEGAATSDHGWDLQRDASRLAPHVAALKRRGIRVSLFMDPDPEAMSAAAALGADRIELYTEPFARDWSRGDASAGLSRYVDAAQAAQAAGLGVNAGHDLNRDNLGDFLAAVPQVREVSIGHALIADALELGLAAAVHAYLQITVGASGDAASHAPAANAGR